MKFELPEAHGIPDKIVASPIIHRGADGEVSITDAQYAGISSGVGLGESILLIAPTSSGKTEVGLIAIATWLTGGDGLSQQAVYLVSHRALARQKFNELRSAVYLGIFGIDPMDIVMSNGDLTIDGNEMAPEDPLSARLLVATYEKFLALLAGSGHRQDMTHFCVVADECQLIADEARGQDIEVLLTMIKLAGFGQFVGLSAVINEADTTKLADWLEVAPIRVHEREIPLEFELRAERSTHLWRTDGPEIPEKIDEKRPQEILDILEDLAAAPDEHFPVAIFCMTKRRINELAKGWSRRRGDAGDIKENAMDLFDEGTLMSEALAAYIPKGFGVHTADLIDTERAVVESKLDSNDLPVVFATTTLAQGLNYSFKTVIFDHWCRWNFARRRDIPIPRSEFHNIAGRAGRLGMQQNGRVIFVARDRNYERAALNYLTNTVEDQVTGRINPALFELVGLQLLSAEIAKNSDDMLDFLKSSLSGFLARDATRDFDEQWRNTLDRAVQKLREWQLVR